MDRPGWHVPPPGNAFLRSGQNTGSVAVAQPPVADATDKAEADAIREAAWGAYRAFRERDEADMQAASNQMLRAKNSEDHIDGALGMARIDVRRMRFAAELQRHVIGDLAFDNAAYVECRDVPELDGIAQEVLEQDDAAIEASVTRIASEEWEGRHGF